MLEIYNQDYTAHAIALKYLTSLHNNSSLKIYRQVKIIGYGWSRIIMFLLS